MLPHDLLPIKRPLEDGNYYPPIFFYQNVITPLIKDIVRIEANGIPIDLEQVRKLEGTLDDILATVQAKIAQNPLIQAYLEQIHSSNQKTKKKGLEAKLRSFQYYLTLFNPKNKTHRSYVINIYLEDINRIDMVMPEWTLKDLRKLTQILADKFLNDLLSGNIQSYMQYTIDKAMVKLASDKAAIYNKNQVQSKIDKLSDKTLPEFNPASTLQIQQFFAMYGVESENTTAGGNPKWDRKELERLQKLLTTMLDERNSKEDECQGH